MHSLFIVLAMYLVLGWITARGYMWFEHPRYNYSDLTAYDQGGVLFCFWFWWLAWIITVSYYISAGYMKYVQPLLSGVWNKIL